MSNFQFVIDSSFQPFSMQEMLMPFVTYKDAFEKSEGAYTELSKGADTFKELSTALPEDSKARKLYEGYANDLTKQAEDLAHNGLTMSNRKALTSLKRRYQGEIGTLIQADAALKEELKLRRALDAQDPSRIYSTDNLSIDDYLPGARPNLYSVSGNDLYANGLEAGKNISARNTSTEDLGSILNGAYRDYTTKVGYDNATLQGFYEHIESIPELQRAAEDILVKKGVNKNLGGEKYLTAKKSVISGIIDGAIYQEQHSPQRDLNTLTLPERIDLALKGVALDKKTGELKVTKKPGEGGDSSSRVPGYTDLQYISHNGEVKKPDGVSNGAYKVNVKTDTNGNITVSVGQGKDSLELGSIDRDGEFTLGSNVNKTTYKKYLGKGLWDWTDTYNPKTDDANIEAMLRDIYEISQREGPDGYLNYNYYLEPDEADWGNDGGGFYREPLARQMKTTANDEDIFEGGAGE